MKKILTKAREAHKEGTLSYDQLTEIFFGFATKEERDEFWSSPAFDRQWIIEGFNQQERDKMFRDTFKG